MNAFTRIALLCAFAMSAMSAAAEPTERWDVLTPNNVKVGELTLAATDDVFFGYAIYEATLVLGDASNTQSFECISPGVAGSFVTLWNCEKDSGNGLMVRRFYGATVLHLKENGETVGSFPVRRSN